ncbi:8-oxoguanine deaminase [Aquibacillus albus]|uniref:Cytosine/adenosine deaminase-related metal-dependent hydrolase n=1 Tax=Aquibacillus albus TaxID=1168171 RepID=A0ABS2MZ05_9BACI|nr:8-oxoguanine deaminase [Aquibacillus albus]MBM7571134.1 cytosine/adenosine deaminase-related metal-dependent hydrolase [Aquibacillus albus]
MKTMLIKNARNIITMNDKEEKFPGGSIYIEGQEIKAIGADLPYETADTVIDARGKIVYPGLINTHHHLYQTFTRNIPFVQNCELFDWLITLYDIWRHLKPEDIYFSAMVGLGELLKSGCTTAADHFYVFPNGVSGELIDEEIKAAQELGIRFFPTRGSMSLGKSKGGLPPDEVVQTEDTILKDTMRVIEQYHDSSRFSMLRVGVAPCSPFSVSPDLLKESAALARSYGVRMHTHLAETRDEEEYCVEKLAMRPLDLMESTGWVGDDVWYAHGIWFNDDEIVKLGSCGCGVAHCPSSNMKMKSGTMPIMKMLQSNVKVGLGVDGSASNDSSNLLMETKVMNLLHNLQHGTKALSAEDCLAVATNGSAKVLGWDDAIGSLEVGKAADMFFIDSNRLEFAGALFDDVSLPILTGTPQVDMTIVGGKVAVKDGQLVTIDEQLIARQAQASASRMVETAMKHSKINYRKSRIKRNFN